MKRRRGDPIRGIAAPVTMAPETSPQEFPALGRAGLADGHQGFEEFADGRFVGAGEVARDVFGCDGLGAFAGLWESWQPPDGSRVESCAILTTAANEFIPTFHDRMPVILSRSVRLVTSP